MSSTASVALRPTGDTSRWIIRTAAVLLGSSLLWASAKVQVPFWPVPMTMQTYVVLTMAALLGWRLAGATMVVYLTEGALGLPVFAGTPTNGVGLAYIAGPTGGYLAGYLGAVLLVGFLAENRWNRSVLNTAAVLLIGELTILTLGCCWLAIQFGWEKALVFGFGPFLFGDSVKIVLAMGTAIYVRRISDRANRLRN